VNVLLWVTHVWTPEIEAEFERIRKAENPDKLEVWLLLDDRTPGADKLAQRYPRCHRFEQETLLALPYPSMYGRPFVDHCHLPLFDFYLAHREYAYYWCVEYDVRYTGDWGKFLSTFEQYDHALITSHIRRFTQEPRYFWWKSLRHPTKEIPLALRLRSLNVVHRISREALQYLHEALCDGWQGLAEVSYPTLLHEGGFRLLDFGGNGAYVLPGYRNRFYTSQSSKTGDIRVLGTVRFRPSRKRAGKRPDTLYHPVKPAFLLEPPGQRLQILTGWGIERVLERVFGW